VDGHLLLLYDLLTKLLIVILFYLDCDDLLGRFVESAEHLAEGAFTEDLEKFIVMSRVLVMALLNDLSSS